MGGITSQIFKRSKNDVDEYFDSDSDSEYYAPVYITEEIRKRSRTIVYEYCDRGGTDSSPFQDYTVIERETDNDILYLIRGYKTGTLRDLIKEQMCYSILASSRSGGDDRDNDAREIDLLKKFSKEQIENSHSDAVDIVATLKDVFGIDPSEILIPKYFVLNDIYYIVNLDDTEDDDDRAVGCSCYKEFSGRYKCSKDELLILGVCKLFIFTKDKVP